MNDFTKEVSLIARTPEEYKEAEERERDKVRDKMGEEQAKDIVEKIKSEIKYWAKKGEYTNVDGKKVIESCCLLMKDSEWGDNRYKFVAVDTFKTERICYGKELCLDLPYKPEYLQSSGKQKYTYTEVIVYDYVKGGGFLHNTDEVRWTVAIKQNDYFKGLCKHCTSKLEENGIKAEAFFVVQKAVWKTSSKGGEREIKKIEFVDPGKMTEISKRWHENVVIYPVIKFSFSFD